jgi:hypothetical protein
MTPPQHEPLVGELIRAVAKAEGLKLTKMVSFRPQDKEDIETLLIANGDEIDVDLVRREWSAVAEGEEARTTWLEETLGRLVPPRLPEKDQRHQAKQGQ